MVMDQTKRLPDFVKEFCASFDVKEEPMKKFYQEFANGYEEIMTDVGYTLPSSCGNVFDKYARAIYGDENAKNMRVIDIGAGTGLVGAYLKKLGYTNIDAFDCSEEMLEKARNKNVYKKIIIAFVDEKKSNDITAEEYDGMISSGAFSAPQIQPRAFDELINWIKKDGILCFSIRKQDLDNEDLGYSQKLQQFEDEKKWKLISKQCLEYLPNRSGITHLSEGFAFVYQKI